MMLENVFEEEGLAGMSCSGNEESGAMTKAERDFDINLVSEMICGVYICRECMCDITPNQSRS